MRGNGVIQHRALQGELATPEHPQATNNGACSRDAPGPTDQLGASAGLHTRHRRAAPVRAQRGTQPRPPKAPCAATKVKTAWARTSPHLQRCDRGVDGPGAGDDGPPAAGEGGHVTCAPAAGRVSISVPAPQRCFSRHPTVFFKPDATLALNDLFEYFVLPKALKPY